MTERGWEAQSRGVVKLWEGMRRVMDTEAERKVQEVATDEWRCPGTGEEAQRPKAVLALAL